MKDTFVKVWFQVFAPLPTFDFHLRLKANCVIVSPFHIDKWLFESLWVPKNKSLTDMDNFII